MSAVEFEEAPELADEIGDQSEEKTLPEEFNLSIDSSYLFKEVTKYDNSLWVVVKHSGYEENDYPQNIAIFKYKRKNQTKESVIKKSKDEKLETYDLSAPHECISIFTDMQEILNHVPYIKTRLYRRKKGSLKPASGSRQVTKGKGANKEVEAAGVIKKIKKER